jgi:hypothetical protein
MDANSPLTSLKRLLLQVNRAAGGLKDLSQTLGQSGSNQSTKAELRNIQRHFAVIENAFKPLAQIPAAPSSATANWKEAGDLITRMASFMTKLNQGDFLKSGNNVLGAYATTLEQVNDTLSLDMFHSKLRAVVNPLKDAANRTNRMVEAFKELITDGRVSNTARDAVVNATKSYETAVTAYNELADKAANNGLTTDILTGMMARAKEAEESSLVIQRLVNDSLIKAFGQAKTLVAPQGASAGRAVGREFTPITDMLMAGDVFAAFRQMQGTLPVAWEGMRETLREVDRNRTAHGHDRVKSNQMVLSAGSGMLSMIMTILVSVFNKADQAGKDLNKSIISTMGAKSMGMPLDSIRDIVTGLAGVGKLHLKPEDVVASAGHLLSAGYSMRRFAKQGNEAVGSLLETVKSIELAVTAPAGFAGEYVAAVAGGFGVAASQAEAQAFELMRVAAVSKMDIKSFFGTFQTMFDAFDGFADRTRELTGIIALVGKNSTMTGPLVQQFFNDVVGVVKKGGDDEGKNLMKTAFLANHAKASKIVADELAFYKKQAVETGPDSIASFRATQIELILATYEDTGMMADLEHLARYMGPTAIARMQLMALEQFYGKKMTAEALRGLGREYTSKAAARVIGIADDYMTRSKYFEGLAAVAGEDLSPEAMRKRLEEDAAKREALDKEKLADLNTKAHSTAEQIAAGMQGIFQKIFDGIQSISGLFYQLIQKGFDLGDYSPLADVVLPGGGTPGVGYGGPQEYTDGGSADIPKQLLQWKVHVEAAAAKYKVPAAIIYAIMDRETGGRNIIGDHGFGHGLMQIDHRSHGAWVQSHQNGLDAASNIDYGTQVLKQNLTYFKGDYAKALAAYNAGAGNVDAALKAGKGADAYTTGKNYGSDVLKRAAKYGLNSRGSQTHRPAPTPVKPVQIEVAKGTAPTAPIKAQLNVGGVFGAQKEQVDYEITVLNAKPTEVNAFLQEMANRGAKVNSAKAV